MLVFGPFEKSSNEHFANCYIIKVADWRAALGECHFLLKLCSPSTIAAKQTAKAALQLNKKRNSHKPHDLSSTLHTAQPSLALFPFPSISAPCLLFRSLITSHDFRLQT